MAAAADYRRIERGTARVLKITGTASYPTGGYSIPDSLVSQVANQPNPPVGINDGATNIALVDLPNKNVKFIVAATGLEVANATNVSANSVLVLLP